jgi:acetyl esterase/lipase
MPRFIKYVRAFTVSAIACSLPVLLNSFGLAQVPDSAAIIAPSVFNADTYPEHNVSFPGGVPGIPDLVYYSPATYRPDRMDLYLPPASFKGPRPFVVFVHGGAFAGGSKRTTGTFANWPGVLAALSAKGYVVASIDYRLLGDAIAPAAFQDTKAAFRFLRANASKYNIDKDRGLVWGPSAGGQIAALVATSCNVPELSPPMRPAGGPGAPGAAFGRAPAAVETRTTAPTGMDAESDCVQGAVSWYGSYDTVAQNVDHSEEPFMGCVQSAPTCTEKMVALSATTYLSDKTPPFLIVHGMTDRLVSVSQAQNFYAALQAKGLKGEIMLLPGIGHSFIGTTPEATRKASLDALNRTFQFIDATIGDKK